MAPRSDRCRPEQRIIQLHLSVASGIVFFCVFLLQFIREGVSESRILVALSCAPRKQVGWHTGSNNKFSTLFHSTSSHCCRHFVVALTVGAIIF